MFLIIKITNDQKKKKKAINKKSDVPFKLIYKN